MKLYCSRVEYNPKYKEDLITEIPENVFQIDGYSIAERQLEGMKFNIYFEGDKVTKVEIPDIHSKAYFEETFNSEKFYKKVEKYGNDILETGDEVDVPQFIKDKYYINGISVSYIAE